MLLASLRPVGGRDGGAKGGREGDPDGGTEGDRLVRVDPAPMDGVRAMEGAVRDRSSAEVLVVVGKAAAEETLRVSDGGVEEKVGWEMFMGGVFNDFRPREVVDAWGKGGTGGVVVMGGGAPVILTARDGGPLGGGGFDSATAGAVSPFLFTHFLRLES